MPTNYPGSLDNLPRPSASTLMNASGYEGASVIDNLSDAVEAVQAELGTDPAGAQATVKARLAAADMLSGPQGTYWPSGGYVLNSISCATAVTQITVADRVNYVPWWCPFDVTLDRIAVEVTTGVASANARIGIYTSSTTTGGPSSLVADLGEIDCATTGVKELTISQALSGGVHYWLALFTESAITFRCSSTASARPVGVADTATIINGMRLVESLAYTTSCPSSAGTLGYALNGSFFFWLRRS